MASRFENYQQRVGVEDAGSFRPVLPEVAGVGDAISSLGDALLRTAEPVLKEKAEREALAEAGTREIVKVGEGFAAGEPIPQGAGRVYAEVYNRVMTARLRQHTVKAFEAAMIPLQREKQDDPQGFFNEARGRMEGVLKATDPSIRADVEVDLLREISERHRGLGEAFVRRERAAMVSGLEETAETAIAEAALIYKEFGQEGAERAEVALKPAREAYAELRRLGEIDDKGLAAASKRMDLSLYDEKILAESTANFAALGPMLKDGADDAELARLELFGRGTTDGGVVSLPAGDGKTLEIDFDEFKRMFKDPTVRAAVGSTANAALSDRQRAADKAAQDAKDAAQAKSSEELLAEVRKLNEKPAQGFNGDETAALESDYSKGGSAYDQMQTPQGRDNTAAWVATNGFLPTGLKEYLDTQVLSSEPSGTTAVAEFINNVRAFNARGAWVGQIIFEKLDTKTQATVELESDLRAAGIPESERHRLIMESRQDRLPTLEEVKAASNSVSLPSGVNRIFDPLGVTQGRREAKTNYNELRLAALANVTGVDKAFFRRSPDALRMFDTLVTANFQVHGGNIVKAMKATATMVSRRYNKDPIYVGGLGPRDVTQAMKLAGTTAGDLDRAMSGDRAFQGATFANGRLKLRLMHDNPTKGFGAYQLVATNARGDVVASKPVDLDDTLPSVLRQSERRKAQQAAKNRASVQEAPWVWRKDANGVYRYVYTR